MLCTTVVHSDTHKHVNSLGLEFIFVCFLCVASVGLDYFISVLLASVVLDLFSSIPSHEICKEERH